MIWVVGTGRCGMHNYTAIMRGFIQSRQDWKGLCLKRYHDGLTNDEELLVRRVIETRKNLPHYCVTDCAQFIFIDLIRNIDSEAKFVWLVEDKKKVVDGFMEKGGEDKRIHPKGWEFKHENKRKLLEWYYDEVNSIIEKSLVGADFVQVKNSDVPRATEEDIMALRAYA